MAGELIKIPNFEFSAFYYPQLLEALINYKRENLPELTDESDKEPLIQLLRAFALVGHLNNVLIDLVANEATLPTAQLPETIRNMLRLINYELKPATAAQTDVVYQLSKVFTTSFALVPAGGQCATTQGDGEQPAIFYEALDGLSIGATNVVGAAFHYDASAAAYLDRTSNANSGSLFTDTWESGDILYIGHATVMFDKVDFFITTVGPITSAVWEYYDGDFNDSRPDAVDIFGGGLTMLVNGILGNQNRAGAIVRVKLNSSGTFEDVVSQWDGVDNFIASSLLGQAVPSLNASDYTVGSDWKELEGVVDGTELLDKSGSVTFTLPQNETNNWKKATVNAFTGFFVRLRIMNASVAVGPTMGAIDIDTGKQYALAQVTQGRTVTAETLGSSNGAPNQEFPFQQDNFIVASEEVRVDAEAWVKVDNFLSSAPQDKHYRIELGTNDRASAVFGDGVNGKILPVGQGNVVADYRFGAKLNGNVGALSINVDKQGLTFVERIFNPRAATGWKEAQAASVQSLERAKIEGPASLRIKDVALSPDDLVLLVENFISADGSAPFSRAYPIEEGYGPKTVELVVVGRGGAPATQDQLDELTVYLNGDPTASPPKKKHFICNHEVVCSNFIPKPTDVTATVHAPGDVLADQVINQLSAILQPEALKEDGITWVWAFGAEIPTSRISHEIFETDPRIEKVVLTIPASNTTLLSRELPKKGVFAITMVPTS